MPETYSGVEVEFVLTIRDEDEEVLTSLVMDKEDILTLVKLLTNAVEHSTVRRFQWFTEVLCEPEETPSPIQERPALIRGRPIRFARHPIRSRN